jgi:hypothetical protein
MTTPRVTEIPLGLAPVEPDPFIDAPSRSSAVRRRLSEREARQRRVESVRGVMRARAAGIRNGWPAARTQRA